MIKILVVTHGEMAQAILSTMGMIMGEMEGVSFASLGRDDTPDALDEAVEARIREMDPQKEGVLILVDMKGGTPFHCALRMEARHKVRMVTGVSLPMLFKAVSHRDEMDLDRLTVEVQKAARENIHTSIELKKRN